MQFVKCKDELLHVLTEYVSNVGVKIIQYAVSIKVCLSYCYGRKRLNLSIKDKTIESLINGPSRHWGQPLHKGHFPYLQKKASLHSSTSNYWSIVSFIWRIHFLDCQRRTETALTRDSSNQRQYNYDWSDCGCNC